MNDPIKTNVTANIINRMDVGSKENNGINNFDNIVKMGEKSKMCHDDITVPAIAHAAGGRVDTRQEFLVISRYSSLHSLHR